jgi:SAM-dependent methyltransferase
VAEDNSKIFNRILLAKRRNRAAAGWGEHNFLKREAAMRLADSLSDVKRSFALALDLGCHRGELAKALRGRAQTLIGCDFAEAMGPQVVCDEELLPFAPDTFDLVISALSLHHVNDLPGTLIQILKSLKPDGLFLAILPGANTLKELRASITGASAEHGFALSPRLSPLIEVRDAGALLQRAGFALPVVDSDMITVEYDTAFKLMEDLRGMGEGNVLIEQRKTLTSRLQLAAIADYYRAHFSDGKAVKASFEFITMIGWKPHASQQKPAQRGSGKVNLKQVL